MRSILPKIEQKKFNSTGMAPQVKLFLFVFGRIEDPISKLTDIIFMVDTMDLKKRNIEAALEKTGFHYLLNDTP